jgi:hypothetical protein
MVPGTPDKAFLSADRPHSSRASLYLLSESAYFALDSMLTAKHRGASPLAAGGHLLLMLPWRRKVDAGRHGFRHTRTREALQLGTIQSLAGGLRSGELIHERLSRYPTIILPRRRLSAGHARVWEGFR